MEAVLVFQHIYGVTQICPVNKVRAKVKNLAYLKNLKRVRLSRKKLKPYEREIRNKNACG